MSKPNVQPPDEVNESADDEAEKERVDDFEVKASECVEFWGIKSVGETAPSALKYHLTKEGETWVEAT